MEHKVLIYRYEANYKTLIPYYEHGIQAGFPSPGADYLENAIDLNEALIQNPSSTFIGRIKGTSMKDIGIFDNSLAIIDKSLSVKNGNMVVAFVDNGFTLKLIKMEKNRVFLMPCNKDFEPILMDESNEGMVWGRVTYIINQAV